MRRLLTSAAIFAAPLGLVAACTTTAPNSATMATLTAYGQTQAQALAAAQAFCTSQNLTPAVAAKTTVTCGSYTLTILPPSGPQVVIRGPNPRAAASAFTAALAN